MEKKKYERIRVTRENLKKGKETTFLDRVVYFMYQKSIKKAPIITPQNSKKVVRAMGEKKSNKELLNVLDELKIIKKQISVLKQRKNRHKPKEKGLGKGKINKLRKKKLLEAHKIQSRIKADLRKITD